MKIGLFYQIQVPKPGAPPSESQRIYEHWSRFPTPSSRASSCSTPPSR
jgi:hypothetical protein